RRFPSRSASVYASRAIEPWTACSEADPAEGEPEIPLEAQVTVFCPNCGKPNTDTATQCVACGTALKPKAAGSKFKGTMMMTGVAPPRPAAPAEQPAPGASPAGPPQAAPSAPAP